MEGTIAFITPWAANFAPRTWAFCQGQIMSIANNTALFSLIGTVYGGNGTTTFALPDLQGRVAIGEGQGPGLTFRPIGSKSGTETTTLTTQQMAMHTHGFMINSQMEVNGNLSDSDSPEGTYPGVSTQGNAYNDVAGVSQFAGTLNVSSQIANTGSGQPFTNLQPFLCLNYIICLTGIFPSRN